MDCKLQWSKTRPIAPVAADPCVAGLVASGGKILTGASALVCSESVRFSTPSDLDDACGAFKYFGYIWNESSPFHLQEKEGLAVKLTGSLQSLSYGVEIVTTRLTTLREFTKSLKALELRWGTQAQEPGESAFKRRLMGAPAMLRLFLRAQPSRRLYESDGAPFHKDEPACTVKEKIKSSIVLSQGEVKLSDLAWDQFLNTLTYCQPLIRMLGLLVGAATLQYPDRQQEHFWLGSLVDLGESAVLTQLHDTKVQAALRTVLEDDLRWLYAAMPQTTSQPDGLRDSLCEFKKKLEIHFLGRGFGASPQPPQGMEVGAFNYCVERGIGSEDTTIQPVFLKDGLRILLSARPEVQKEASIQCRILQILRVVLDYKSPGTSNVAVPDCSLKIFKTCCGLPIGSGLELAKLAKCRLEKTSVPLGAEETREGPQCVAVENRFRVGLVALLQAVATNPQVEGRDDLLAAIRSCLDLRYTKGVIECAAMALAKLKDQAALPLALKLVSWYCDPDSKIDVPPERRGTANFETFIGYQDSQCHSLMEASLEILDGAGTVDRAVVEMFRSALEHKKKQLEQCNGSSGASTDGVQSPADLLLRNTIRLGRRSGDGANSHRIAFLSIQIGRLNNLLSNSGS